MRIFAFESTEVSYRSGSGAGPYFQEIYAAPNFDAAVKMFLNGGTKYYPSRLRAVDLTLHRKKIGTLKINELIVKSGLLLNRLVS